jgi:hypothetical protein
MNATSIGTAAASVWLSALTVGLGIAGADPALPASPPVAQLIPPAAPVSAWSVLASPPRPADISWSWDWDDDDEDWGQTVSWDCPAGCSITWEDW